MTVFFNIKKKMTSLRVLLLIAAMAMLAIDLMNKIPADRINWNDFSTYSTDLGLIMLIAVLAISLLIEKLTNKRKSRPD